FCFNWKKTAAEAHRMLVKVYGDNAASDKTCREWFRCFNPFVTGTDYSRRPRDELLLIFCFNWKKTAAEAHRMLVKVYGDNAASDKTCREWFRCF
ncbi:hypothetical protein EAI_08601, partial [Harpegnathos saltator]